MNRKLISKLGLEADEYRPGADDPKRIAEFEKAIGKRLPEDYREFLLEFAPGGFSGNAAFRPLEPTPWSEDGLNCFDAFYGVEENSTFDLTTMYRDTRGAIPSGMFAIGYDSGSNNILMSLNDPKGQIYFEDKDDGEVYLCANTFTEFLQSFELLPDEEV